MQGGVENRTESALQKGVPIMVMLRFMAAIVHEPKSANFTVPSFVSSMFAPLMSLPASSHMVHKTRILHRQ
jgi:hypothetical protein